MNQNENTNELYHHGVLGMKWGRRRYQNKDGTLTPTGRKRADKIRQQYLEVTGKKLTGYAVRKKGETIKSVKKEPIKPKSYKEMSDEELKSVTNRMKLENDYIDTLSKMNKLNPKKISKGKKFMNMVAKDIFAPAALDVAKQLGKSYMVKLTNEGLNLSNEYKVYTNNKKKDK